MCVRFLALSLNPFDLTRDHSGQATVRKHNGRLVYNWSLMVILQVALLKASHSFILTLIIINC